MTAKERSQPMVLVPAQAFHPGEYVAEELKERGWSAERLSELSGLSVGYLRQLIAEKLPVTARTTLALGRAFGTGPCIWLSLQSQYQTALSGIADREAFTKASDQP